MINSRLVAGRCALFALGATLAAFALLGCTGSPQDDPHAPLSPQALRTEYLVQPLAIGDGGGGAGGAARAPRFTWEGHNAGGDRNARQLAYEIQVATTAELARSERPDVWRSGKLSSSESTNVAYGGPTLKAGATYFWAVRTWGQDGSAPQRAGEHGGGGAVESDWSAPAMFGVGLLSPGDWHGAKWIGDPTPPPAVVAATKDGEKGAGVKGHPLQGMEALPAPMLRKEFEVGGGGPVRRAMLYISALGLYEARINGERVGDHDLAPEWTDYNVRVQYQGYDVTKMLRAGEKSGGDNAIGVTLADGWYAGRLGMAQQFSEHKWPRAVYGRQPRLIALLVIERQDGTTQRVITDGSWRSTLGGPIRSADLLDGQVEDARRAIPGWDRPGFVEPAGAPWAAVVVDSGVKAELVAQPNEPIRVIQEITPVAVKQVGPSKWVFDLGQNMAGRCRIAVKGAAGAEVVLRHAEAVNDDGTIYTANLRGAPQVDRYTLGGAGGGEASGKAEVFEPRFTYHGFRFVEVSGDIRPPTTDDLRGVVVCSSSPVVGSFECSSPLLNRLWLNILWTQHANMMSVPTDCPQRDERLGWTGDIVAFGQTAIFNKDMAAFFTKWFQDVRDAQADDGRYPDVAPHPYGKNRHFTGVPAWGDVGVTVPWEAYVNYGDRRLLEEHFESAKRWVEWVHSNNGDLIWRNARHNDYNDWLNGDTLVKDGWPRTGAGVPNEILATAFFARSTQLLGEMARVLGKEDAAAEYAALHEKIRAAFCKAFVAEDGRMPGDTQAGYALALNFDLVPVEQRPKLAAHLVEGIHKYNNHLSTGFHTSQRALLELTKAGQTELAYQLVLDTRFPSWGYSIENGATTIWERWDGYVKGRGFQDPGMNSLNHWALGSVGEWLTRVVLGINPDPASPGYAHFVLAPRPGGGLTFARGGYRSVRGQIESSWRVEQGRTIYTFVVPPNTSATVRLQALAAAAVTEGGQPLDRATGVRQVSATGGEVLLEIGSGRYVFTVQGQP